MRTRVLLAEDHQVMRQGLRSLLENEGRFTVVGETDSGESTVRAAQEKRPDVVLLDVVMPGMNGIEATRHICATVPAVKVIGLSAHAARRYVTEMLKAGAFGYLLKSCAFDELIRAIRTVLAGEVYLCSKITGVVVEHYARGSTSPSPSAYDVLSSRERQVLQLLAEGLSTKEMASRLHVSQRTVETHRRKISQKLGIRSIAALTKYAIREGLASLEP